LVWEEGEGRGNEKFFIDVFDTRCLSSAVPNLFIHRANIQGQKCWQAIFLREQNLMVAKKTIWSEKYLILSWFAHAIA
jgi:hypothetical protein